MQVRSHACRRLANELLYLREHFGKKLSVVFKHYPLSTDCNPNGKIDRHPGSCKIGCVAEAARRQGRFWQFHDAMFAANRASSEETIRQVSKKLHLDPHQMAVDGGSKELQKKVATDIAQCHD